MPIPDSRKVAEQAATDEIIEYLSVTQQEEHQGYYYSPNMKRKAILAIITRALDAYAAAVLRGAAEKFSTMRKYEGALVQVRLRALAAQQEKK